MTSAIMNAKPPTWSLIIATYQREEVLRRCLRLAASQSRPPSEIIVIDASPSWESTRQTVLGDLAGFATSIRLTYNKANVASSALQRNQGAALATSDILVFIDDDTLMYPDCAEQFMHLYDLDVEGRIAGVGMVMVPEVPDRSSRLTDSPQSESATAEHADLGPLNVGIGGFVRKLLRADDIFIPYDYEWPQPAPPSWLATRGDIAGLRRTLTGNRMSVRRQVFENEPFETILIRYASGEDSDMSYRASRHGVLLTSFNAKICHLHASGGRLGQFVVSALGGMNALVLHRIYGKDPGRSLRLSKQLLRRRVLIEALKDLRAGRLSFARARGLLLVLRMANSIFEREPSDLRAWYPGFQAELIKRHLAT